MIKDALSMAADEVLNYGIAQAMGPPEVSLTGAAIKSVRKAVRDEVREADLDSRLEELETLVKSTIPDYRDNKNLENLKKVRQQAEGLATGLRTHVIRSRIRHSYKPYLLAQSIRARSYKEGNERFGRDWLNGYARQGSIALKTMLEIEKFERRNMTFYAYARFKRYTIEGHENEWYDGNKKWNDKDSVPGAVYKGLPKETRDRNGDPIRWMGTRYYQLIRSFFQALRGNRADDMSKGIPRPQYVCKMYEVSRNSLGLRPGWYYGQYRNRKDFMMCFPKDGYYPVGDTVGWGDLALYVKPLGGSPEHIDDWGLVWDDRSADKFEKPRNRPPIGFWRAMHRSGYDSLGHIVAPLGNRGRLPREHAKRILVFRKGDIVQGDAIRGEYPEHAWKDAGSGADKDVCIHPHGPKGDRRGPHFTTGPGGGMWCMNDYKYPWLKPSTLDGFVPPKGV